MFAASVLLKINELCLTGGRLRFPGRLQPLVYSVCLPFRDLPNPTLRVSPISSIFLQPLQFIKKIQSISYSVLRILGGAAQVFILPVFPEGSPTFIAKKAVFSSFSSVK